MSVLTPVVGHLVVAVAGTAQPLSATELRVQSVTIQADEANTTPACVGGSGVDQSTEPGITLDAGEFITKEAPRGFWLDLATIYIDVETGGESVKYLYWS